MILTLTQNLQIRYLFLFFYATPQFIQKAENLIFIKNLFIIKEIIDFSVQTRYISSFLSVFFLYELRPINAHIKRFSFNNS